MFLYAHQVRKLILLEEKKDQGWIICQVAVCSKHSLSFCFYCINDTGSASKSMFTHSMLFMLFLCCKYDTFHWLLVHYFLCGFLSCVLILPFVLWLSIKPGTHLSPLSANMSSPLTSVGVRWASHLSWWDLCSVITQHPPTLCIHTFNPNPPYWFFFSSSFLLIHLWKPCRLLSFCLLSLQVFCRAASFPPHSDRWHSHSQCHVYILYTTFPLFFSLIKQSCLFSFSWLCNVFNTFYLTT